MTRSGRAFVAGLVSMSAWMSMLAIGNAQLPIRIGASLSQSGAFKALSQNQVGRGYALCVKHTNDKGGVLGQRLELVLADDQSQPAIAASIYERLITQDKVDLVLGPYGSPMTATVAEVVEKHRMPMVAAGTATTSLFKQGRKFIFMVHPPGEVYLEGLIDMAAKRGLKTVAYDTKPVDFPRLLGKIRALLAKTPRP